MGGEEAVQQKNGEGGGGACVREKGAFKKGAFKKKARSRKGRDQEKGAIKKRARSRKGRDLRGRSQCLVCEGLGWGFGVGCMGSIKLLVERKMLQTTDKRVENGKNPYRANDAT